MGIKLMDGEEIKPISDFDNYFITSFGRVWSKNSEDWLKGSIDGSGYPFVILYKNGKYKTFKRHRLVAEYFIPNPLNLSIINHKDENKKNSRVNNLEWCDYSYNNTYNEINKKRAENIRENGKLLNNNYASKCIAMCDKETHEVIQKFESMKAAATFLGHPSSISGISKVCKGERTSALGYFWKYSIDND